MRARVWGDHHGQGSDGAGDARPRIGNELTEIFIRYVRGEVDFAEATFAAYDVLEDLHVIASGDYELEEEDLDEYDEAMAPRRRKISLRNRRGAKPGRRLRGNVFREQSQIALFSSRWPIGGCRRVAHLARVLARE